MRRLFANAKFNFIGARRRAYLGSGSALVLSLLIAIFWQLKAGGWLNYGVDFSGGTLIQVRFSEPVDVAQLRGLLEPTVPGTEITRFGGGGSEYLIRAPRVEGPATSGAAETIPRLLEGRFGAGKFTVEDIEAVGAKVGGELREKAVLAVLLSFVATLIYLAFRFEWRFGLAAVIATAHDTLLTLGLISILQLDVSLPTVAAVLTIVGYSLNDTIIIFDRIRENLRGPGRRDDFIAILNRSINETLPRTVLTAGTTLATLFTLFVFGTGMIREFALIMIVGIVLGTYSSVFVAAPALLEIEKRWPGEKPRIKRRPRTARAGARS